MKTFTAALAGTLALVLASAAGAVGFGANDDTGKYAENPAPFFQKMAALGMNQNVMTVRWTPGSSAIPDQGFLDRAVPVALANGIEVVFAVYPYPPSAIEAGQASAEGFAAWLGTLASRYPQVTRYIVGNEPNLNTFWRPQGDGSGTILSAAAFGPFLAAAYDALKPRGAQVLGVGHSPRGDRTPDRASKTAPVVFLKALGEWYRSSGRTAPLMDGFSYHPYPNPSDFTVPLSFTYGWPNAGVQELDRVKQALWDAFNGTGQPTTADGLQLFLDEVGWQVGTDGKPGYTGSENVKVTTDENQAQLYGDLIRFVVCDPDVAQLNFFGFYDEAAREGWQAAPHHVDGTPRASAASIAQAIAQTGGRCQGASRSWRPASGVVGGAAEFAARQFSAKQRVFGFSLYAEEDYAWTAGIFPAGTAESEITRELASRKAAVASAKGDGKAYFRPRVELRTKLADGSYVFAAKLTSWANPSRTQTIVSDPFAVGAGAAGGPSGGAAGVLATVKARQSGKVGAFAATGTGKLAKALRKAGASPSPRQVAQRIAEALGKLKAAATVQTRVYRVAKPSQAARTLAALLRTGKPPAKTPLVASVRAKVKKGGTLPSKGAAKPLAPGTYALLVSLKSTTGAASLGATFTVKAGKAAAAKKAKQSKSKTAKRTR